MLLFTAMAAIVAGQLKADIDVYPRGQRQRYRIDNGARLLHNLTSGGPCNISGLNLTCVSSNGAAGLQSIATLAAPVATTVVPETIYIGDPSGNVSDEITTGVSANNLTMRPVHFAGGVDLRGVFPGSKY